MALPQASRTGPTSWNRRGVGMGSDPPSFPSGRCFYFFSPKKTSTDWLGGERGVQKQMTCVYIYMCAHTKIGQPQATFEDHRFLRWASYMVDSPARFWMHWFFVLCDQWWISVPRYRGGVQPCVVKPWNSNHTTYPNPNIAPSMKKTPSSLEETKLQNWTELYTKPNYRILEGTHFPHSEILDEFTSHRYSTLWIFKCPVSSAKDLVPSSLQERNLRSHLDTIG